ncbi:MAG: hypothetical protein ACKO37_07905 [Vampirovibrionales bacterium]
MPIPALATHALHVVPPVRLIVLMVLLPLILFLPVKFTALTLQKAARSVWISGGVAMIASGYMRLSQVPHLSWEVIVPAMVVALCLGLLKGHTVLKKSALQNVERLHVMHQTAEGKAVYLLRAMYPVKSWVMILLMVGLAVLLGVLHVPDVWRGAIVSGIGLALVIASQYYLPTLHKPSASAVS